MASRLKEDERNERTIRNLLKLPENRRCINCNSLGPQYVCTSFWTFVCTTCSGIHREFTHRVKSVSMAKFTTQEVSALQGGGNASAKEIYFKEWDAQRQSFPDSSNVERLRDFIKHVYVDRRYSGERSFDKPPRTKMGETTEDAYQGGSRSPPYENERRYSDRPSPGGRSDTSSRNSYDERRSPEYNQNQDFKKSSPARSDVVNDWRREDRFSKTPDLGRSPDRQKDISSPPLVRPVREILGESVSPLRVIEPPPKTNGGSTSLQPQRTASSSSLASSNGNPPPTELRRESSLIDFDTDDPQPTPSTASVPVPQTQQIPASVVPVSLNDNWANFDSTPTPVVTKPMPSSQAPSGGGNLLDMLSELSVPASGNNPQVSLFGTNPPPPPPPAAVAPPSAFVHGGGPAAPPPFDVFGNSGGGPQWQNVQPQQNVMQPPALFNQAPSVDSQVTSKPAAKQELPADLFTSSYSPFGGQGAPGWYPAPQYGMGFNMQYNVPMQQHQHMPPAFGQPPRSANPFDVNESPAVQAPTMFPSMAPLQNALPNMGPPPSGIQQAWMPPQPSHPLATPPYGSSMPSGPFMGQPPQPQSRGQVGNFGYDLTSLGSMNNPNQQQQSGLYTPTPTPNTFSSNPFG